MVGYAIVIPCLQKEFKHKFNDNSSSYTAESIAIIKANLSYVKGVF